MTYIKLIFFLILMMMDRCGIISTSPVIEDVGPVSAKTEDLKLDGSWRLAHAKVESISSDTINNASSKNPVQLEREDDFLLSFFPDSSFTKVDMNGKYVVGTWNFSKSDSIVSIIYPNKTEKFKPLFSTDNGLRLVTLTSVSGKELNLAGFGKSMEKFEDDPFYSTHNSWRFKPSRSENEAKIAERLIDYLSHNVKLLQSAETRRQSHVSWEFSKGILKIYNGGIGLVSQDQIPPIWINSFYSEEEALTAYAMLDNYLRTTSYRGSATGNWVKDDYNILISIVSGMKKRYAKPSAI